MSFAGTSEGCDYSSEDIFCPEAPRHRYHSLNPDLSVARFSFPFLLMKNPLETLRLISERSLERNSNWPEEEKERFL